MEFCLPPLSFQDCGGYMCCIIEMKARQYACRSCYFFKFVSRRLCSHVKTFLYILFAGLGLNGEWSGDFSGEASTRQKPFVHRSLAPLLVFFSASLSFISNLSHLPPASQSSLYTSFGCPVSPLACSFHFLLYPCSPVLILVLPGPSVCLIIM